jgi:nucleoside-diphosphate-sugar epimerase
MPTALVVGGTAATGFSIVQEVLRRGYEVTVYHRGAHEVPGLEALEHIHGEPHFAETIARDLAGRRFDLVVATYGRVRLLAEELKGRTARMITVGGTPVVRAVPGIPRRESDGYVDAGNGLVDRMIETERLIMEHHARGEYVGTVVRYPYVYGPYSIIPSEWHVIRRVLDGRRRWIMPGGGLGISTRCAAPNAAHTIGLAIDWPEVAGGQVYQAADDRQYSFREWVEMTAQVMDSEFEFEFVDIPRSALPTGDTRGSFSGVPQGGGPRAHGVLSNEKARRELGYEDVVAPDAWLRRTVEFWLEHPPVVDGEGNHLKPEEFDYAAEDALLQWWDSIAGSAPRVGSGVVRRHPYPHPERPGEQIEG